VGAITASQTQGRVLAATVAPVAPGTPFKAELRKIAVPAARSESLDDVLRRYGEARTHAPAQPRLKGSSGLIVFVFFFMPKDAIRELTRQASKAATANVSSGTTQLIQFPPSTFSVCAVM
jgi:hypothetical protein